MFDVDAVKKDFPIFEKQPGLAFLDNASTTQKPWATLVAMGNFYVYDNANVHRGVYELAERADAAYEAARVACALYVGAAPEEIVFVKNATEAANLVAYSYGDVAFGPDRALSNSGGAAGTGDDNIVVTELEHHSNYLPWQELAARKGASLRVMPIDVTTGKLREDGLAMIDQGTRIVAVTMMSNVLGVMPDIGAIVKAAKAVGAKVVLDAAQGVAHADLDVKKLSVDFAFVTGHKIFGPMGIGFLYGKKELLEKMQPLMTGGGMIKELPNKWLDSPTRFEAGTPHVAGAIGMVAGLTYMENLPEGWREHEIKLASMARIGLSELEKVKVFPGENSIVAFAIDGIHPHDIASILAENEVCIRAGHHCAKPLMKSLGVNATARASFSIYNTEDDVKKLIDAVKQVLIVFK